MPERPTSEPASALSANESVRLHATTVARDGYAALLRGPSGAGKSDLALRFLASLLACPVTTAGSHALIADDQTIVSRRGDALVVACPAAIKGRLEVRGIGIVACPVAETARLALVVDLLPSGHIERLPEPGRETLLGVAIDRIALAPFEASAAIKLALALDRARLRIGLKP